MDQGKEEQVTTKLTAICQVIIDWLKYAEAKNAVLLTFSGAGITATLTYLGAVPTLPRFLKIGFLMATFFLCLSAFICAISFLPKTNLENLTGLREKSVTKRRQSQKNSDNLYYYGDLQKYNSEELLDKMNEFYFDRSIQLPYKKEHLDIASQIVINSEIALIKFKLFTISLWLLIFSFFSIPTLFFLKLFKTNFCI
jgi:hypothetical protein